MFTKPFLLTKSPRNALLIVLCASPLLFSACATTETQDADTGGGGRDDGEEDGRSIPIPGDDAGPRDAGDNGEEADGSGDSDADEGSGLTDAGPTDGGGSGPDIALPDASGPDTGVPDTAGPDASVPDTSTPDTSTPDAGVPDTGTPDTGRPDTGAPDTGTPDTGTPDTGTPDTGTPAECGDGKIDRPGETCDDRDDEGGDGCSATCVVETGWTCRGEPSICTEVLVGDCGNGTVNVGEECDDNNLVDGDGCSSECLDEGELSCPVIIGQLSCNTSYSVGPVTGGSNTFNGYSACPGSGTYNAREQVYAFRTAEAQPVRMYAFANAVADYDLFVLLTGDSRECGLDMTCPASSRNTGPAESVNFTSVAGGVYAVVLDGRSSSSTVGNYYFSIECGDPDCGDGIVEGDETCDHGGGTIAGCGATCQAELNQVCGTPTDGCTNVDCTDSEGARPCDDTIYIRRGTDMVLDGRNSTGDPRFNRRGESCTGVGSMSNVPYDVFTIRNVDTIALGVDMEAAWNLDGFLAVYGEGFDPSNPTVDCIGGDDDGRSLYFSEYSVIMPPGAVLNIVTTSFSSSATGNYSLFISATE
jgi:cysteine-rich repeat protein